MEKFSNLEEQGKGKKRVQDHTLSGTEAYEEYQKKRRVDTTGSRSRGQAYRGIFDESRQIMSNDYPWKTAETRSMIAEAQGYLRNNKPDIPCDTAHHMVPRYMLDNIVSQLTTAQAEELGRALGMPDFGSKPQLEQVIAIANRPWNLFLGPNQIECGDPVGPNSLDERRLKRYYTSTSVLDPRSEVGRNIIEIMFSAGSEIRRKERDPEDPFSDEEFKMIRLCFVAAKKFHETILDGNRIDIEYANWVKKGDKWHKKPTAVRKKYLDNLQETSAEIIGSDIIRIADLQTDSLINEFLQFKGTLSNYAENSIKQHGKLSLDQIEEITHTAVDRFVQLQALQGKYADEAPEIARTMRGSLQDNRPQIGDKDPQKMADKDVVETYTRLYFKDFAEIDPQALADAFVAWDGKIHQWGERSIRGSGGYSKENAKNIADAINGKVISLDANKRQKLAGSIKKYMHDENYSNYGQYVHDYIQGFTEVRSGKLSLQAADDFLYNRRLPQEKISQKEAEQLVNTIRIRAGTLRAIGSRSQQEQIKKVERVIRDKNRKNPMDYIREHIKVKEPEIKEPEIEQVFSELCQHGHILPETQNRLCQEGPLSQEATDGLKEEIRKKVLRLNSEAREQLKAILHQHAKIQGGVKEHVDYCLAALRKS